MPTTFPRARLAVCLAAVAAVAVGGQSTTLPQGWTSQDIGAVGQPGSASASAGTFTVSGAGADVWGTADAFHFASRTLAGDVTIVARVASIQGAQAWTKAGVMIRATTQPGSPHAFMLVATSKGVAFQRRTTDGGTTINTGASGAAPRWVRLARTGAVITASVSADGRTWTVVGSSSFAMSSTVLVGLAVSSHDSTRLATGTFDNVSISTGTKPWANGRLVAAPGHHFLTHERTRAPFLYLADTAWSLMRRLNRADADFYLQDCAAKGFNAIQTVALWDMIRANAYGDRPLGTTNGFFDPNRILTTPGTDPADPVAYDYWDHMDYVFDRAEAHGLYVALHPTWGNYVSGVTSYAFDMSSNIFTVANARTFGEFIGRRYGRRPNIIWMLGGDRSAVYPNGDFRPVWRSMAEGIARGVTGQTLAWDAADSGWNQLLMTYQATRRDDPGSSRWFHTDAWLDFNGIQAEYHNITNRLRTDWSKVPTKPAALIEPRYEDELSTDQIVFTGGFKQRYQLYYALLSGAAGYAYGHRSIWQFLTTDKTWRVALNDPGRVAIKWGPHLLAQFSDAEALGRVPDQTLLDGALGSAKTEDLLVAMRGGTGRFALVYSANGRDIRLHLWKLASGSADAWWFSPRTGSMTRAAGPFATGPGAPTTAFNPPGDPAAGNDWILKVALR
jgi:regulation of enolase protein 1 (concanavalin A-like superfamily)